MYFFFSICFSFSFLIESDGCNPNRCEYRHVGITLYKLVFFFLFCIIVFHLFYYYFCTVRFCFTLGQTLGASGQMTARGHLTERPITLYKT